MSRIKGMVYSLPTEGRIVIGTATEEFDGKRTPVALNRFVIKTNEIVNGTYTVHEMHKAVAKATGQDEQKMTFIPIRFIYNDVDVNLRLRYEAYNPLGQLICAGDGECAMRQGPEGLNKVGCPGAKNCEFGKQAKCAPRTRMNVKIDIPTPAGVVNDDYSTFSVKSSDWNSAMALSCKLDAISSELKGNIVGVPMLLTLREKSVLTGLQETVYYLDLVLAQSIEASMKLAKGYADSLASLGINQAGFDAVVKKGLTNSAFDAASEEDDFMEFSEATQTMTSQKKSADYL